MELHENYTDFFGIFYKRGLYQFAVGWYGGAALEALQPAASLPEPLTPANWKSCGCWLMVSLTRRLPNA